jgi:hypothetical protein
VKPRTTPIFPPDTKPSLLKAIQEADAPLKPVQLGKSVESALKLTGPHLKALLAEDLAAGRVFNWGSENAPLYWHREREAEARNRLLNFASGEALTKAQLSAHVAKVPPKIGATVVKSALQSLITEQILCMGPVAGSKTKCVIHTDAYLAAEIARLLKSFGRERPTSRIQALLAPEPETSAESPHADETVQAVASKIFDAMNRIAFSPGTTVTFYRLRQQPELAHIPKAVFDAAALLLQHEQKALLSLHDHAAALPAEERERFVTDGLGTYYVSIYVR